MNIYLVRHAHAGSRHRWSGHDGDRPLSAKGQDQADDITRAFERVPVTRVLSSPARRCQQTVAALAQAHGLGVEIAALLAEDSPLEPARKLLDELAQGDDVVVLCGHGDLIPELLDGLRYDGVDVEGAGCAKGSVWQLVATDGRFERAVYHRHPEDSIPPPP